MSTSTNRGKEQRVSTKIIMTTNLPIDFKKFLEQSQRKICLRIIAHKSNLEGEMMFFRRVRRLRIAFWIQRWMILKLIPREKKADKSLNWSMKFLSIPKKINPLCLTVRGQISLRTSKWLREMGRLPKRFDALVPMRTSWTLLVTTMWWAKTMKQPKRTTMKHLIPQE